jgi:hypothetical protein
MQGKIPILIVDVITGLAAVSQRWTRGTKKARAGGPAPLAVLLLVVLTYSAAMILPAMRPWVMAIPMELPALGVE